MHSRAIELDETPAVAAEGAQAPSSLLDRLANDPALAAAGGLIHSLRTIGRWYDRDDVEEIKINRPGQLEIQTRSERISIDDPNVTLEWANELARRLASFSKQTISEKQPIMYATLPTGDRCTVLIEPAVLPGTAAITIRREYPVSLTLEQYRDSGAFNQVRSSTSMELLDHEKKLLELKDAGKIYEFLDLAIASRCNGIVSGSSGAGKTTLIKALVRKVDPKRRLGSIENVDELKLRTTHRDSVAMFYSLNNQGVSTVNAGALMGSCMRQRLDSVFLAELITPEEAFYYLDSVGADMPGCWTSIHGNNPLGAVDRLTSLIRRSSLGSNMSTAEIHKLIFKSIDIFLQFSVVNNKRVVTDIYYDPAYKRSLEVSRG